MGLETVVKPIFNALALGLSRHLRDIKSKYERAIRAGVDDSEQILRSYEHYLGGIV